MPFLRVPLNGAASVLELAEVPIPKPYLRGQKVAKRRGQFHITRDVRLELSDALAESLEALAQLACTPADHPRQTPQAKRLYLSEILEKFVVDSFPDVFGLSWPDYVRRRRAGEHIDLLSLAHRR